MHIQQKYIVHSSGGREAPNPDTEIEVSWKVPPWILHCALLGASRGRRGGWGLGEPSGMASLQRLLSRQLDDMSWYGYWRDRVLQAGETVKAVCNISVARVRERSEGDTSHPRAAATKVLSKRIQWSDGNIESEGHRVGVAGRKSTNCFAVSRLWNEEQGCRKVCPTSNPDTLHLFQSSVQFNDHPGRE